MPEFSWSLFIILAVSAIFIALGAPIGPLLGLALLIGLLVAYRFPYFIFYTAIALVPFLGFTLSVSTGELDFGTRAFGGSIDIAVAEVLFLLLLFAWALKIIFLWWRRHDSNWRPKFDLARSYSALVGAHILSSFSPLLPDRVLVAKFVMRPVLFCYLAFVALPLNIIHSRRRLVSALSVMSVVGMVGALNGAISLFFVDASSQFIRRAHPLPMFGIPVLGDNHNLLAELMAVTVFLTLSLAMLVRTMRTRRLLYAAAVFQGAIGLLTFSRTVWIVFTLQAVFLAVVEYREAVKRRAPAIIGMVMILIPLMFIMLNISKSNVATSSNSTRMALLEIATQVFLTSPWLGSGAGTFLERVGSAQVFKLEYGEPLDSHGFVQKLAAETGVFGLLAFAAVCFEFYWLCRRGWKNLGDESSRQAVFFLISGAGGAIVYQLFNTNYWTGKMWLPIGLALASLNALASKRNSKNIL